MIIESIGASLLLLLAIRTKNMSDKKKIEKIFEYTKTWVTNKSGEIKHPQYIRKEPIKNDKNDHVGMLYVYRLPLGLPYKKIEYLNDNIGVFKDGLHKNVELEFNNGMLHVKVYETQLPKLWRYEHETLTGWRVPIGKTYKELITHDFDVTPHMVGGGTTRYGKTNLIKVIITSLILGHPDDVEFYLIDLKAGVEFYRYKNLKQVKAVATDVNEVHAMLTDVMAKLDADKSYFRDHGYSNVVDTPIKKRTFIIVDEAGDLVPEKFMSKSERNMYAECQWMLAHIARIGGAFGYRELFFSQYTTADVLPRQIKQNADAKICFKLQNGYSSEVVLGEGNTQAADLDKIKGRAIYKDGANIYELQVPLITDRQMESLLNEYYVRKDNNDINGKTDEYFDELIDIRDFD